MATVGVALLAAGCSSGSSTSTSPYAASPSGGGASPASASDTGTSSDPGARFSTAQIAGVGDVVVDGRGRTVYILTADGRTSAPCTDDSGCTKAWPDIEVSEGTMAPTAGQGVQASLLGSKQENGEAYATYNDWLVYEYAGDAAPGQANGQGIKSFGGTWYALDATGNPVMGSG